MYYRPMVILPIRQHTSPNMALIVHTFDEPTNHAADIRQQVTIRLEIEHRTGRTVSIGAVYATLRRLEDKGFVLSALGEPTASRGGRAKRYFELAPLGGRALGRSRRMVARLWEGVSPAHLDESPQ